MKSRRVFFFVEVSKVLSVWRVKNRLGRYHPQTEETSRSQIFCLSLERRRTIRSSLKIPIRIVYAVGFFFFIYYKQPISSVFRLSPGKRGVSRQSRTPLSFAESADTHHDGRVTRAATWSLDRSAVFACLNSKTRCEILQFIVVIIIVQPHAYGSRKHRTNAIFGCAYTYNDGGPRRLAPDFRPVLASVNRRRIMSWRVESLTFPLAATRSKKTNSLPDSRATTRNNDSLIIITIELYLINKSFLFAVRDVVSRSRGDSGEFTRRNIKRIDSNISLKTAAKRDKRVQPPE